MPQVIEGVYPGSPDASHDLVLTAGRKKYAFRFQNGPQDIRPIPPQRQPPAFPIAQNSWHNGRGIEVWQPNQFGYYDAKDMWTTTPNKLHPQLLTRFATGFRTAEMNFPADGDLFIWKPLYTDANAGNYRYLDVSFTASASSNRERCFLIVRKKVPAGATGTPGTLTVEWCADSSGDPGTVSKTVTKANTDLPDVISYVVEFKPSSVLAVTASTVYHIKIYGASEDSQNNCWEVLCDTAAEGKASTDDATWTAVDWSPFYRITDEDIARRIFFFNFNGAEYAVTSRESTTASELFIHGVRGKATAGAATSLTDSGAGQYGGTFPTMTGWKIRIVKGTGKGQVRTISSNTATVITVPTWDITPDTTSEYVAYHPTAAWKEITGHGLGKVTGKPAYANGTIYFPQDDTVNIRIMQMNYANANDHGFDAESTKNNQALLLQPAMGGTGPVMWRANNAVTAAGSPAGKAVSVGQGETSPAFTPLSFGTDITFLASVLVGDNTFNITGLWNYENQIYVTKEDTMYSIVNNLPIQIDYGASTSPNPKNGIAAVWGRDGLFYVAANHDIMVISGRSALKIGLSRNLPSSRSGYVHDMISELGWLFAAVDANDGDSSVMKFSFDTKTFSEQFRSFVTGRRIRSIALEENVDVRPTLLIECAGEILYQELPLYGTRPVQDSGCLYGWEGGVEFATIDLLNLNEKYFSLLEVNAKGLAGSSSTTAYGREVMFEYQLDNKIGTSEWVHGGAVTVSPISRLRIAKGSRHKIRPRLRIINNDPSDPPIIESTSLTLFERAIHTREWLITLRLESDEDVTGQELYQWLVDMTSTAEPVLVESQFPNLHNILCAISVEPNLNIENIGEEGVEGVAQLLLSQVIE